MEHEYHKYWDYNQYRIMDCQSCGFKHVFPIPSACEVEKYYKEYYFQKVKPYPYHIVTDEYVAGLKESILDNSGFRSMFNRVIELRRTESENMLDIGCGNNLLALFFSQMGWDTTNIEPNKDAGNYLRKFGLSVMNKPVENIDSLNIKDISFVNLQFVLEHITYPFDVLTKINKVMSVGGVIRICVPNDFSEGQLAYMEKYQAEPRWVNLPDHINYFTFDSLSKLLGKVGFKEVYRTTNFPLEFLLMGGLNYYVSEEERNKVGPFVKNFEDSFRTTGREEFLKKYYENLAQQGFGRSIYMYAIKE